jgi:hypothetical protein
MRVAVPAVVQMSHLVNRVAWQAGRCRGFGAVLGQSEIGVGVGPIDLQFVDAAVTACGSVDDQPDELRSLSWEGDNVRSVGLYEHRIGITARRDRDDDAQPQRCGDTKEGCTVGHVSMAPNKVENSLGAAIL